MYVDGVVGENSRKAWIRLDIGPVPTIGDALKDMQIANRIKERISNLLINDLGDKLIIEKYIINKPL